jgi:small subunit ribosomal protein S11
MIHATLQIQTNCLLRGKILVIVKHSSGKPIFLCSYGGAMGGLSTPICGRYRPPLCSFAPHLVGGAIAPHLVRSFEDSDDISDSDAQKAGSASAEELGFKLGQACIFKGIQSVDVVTEEHNRLTSLLLQGLRMGGVRFNRFRIFNAADLNQVGGESPTKVFKILTKSRVTKSSGRQATTLKYKINTILYRKRRRRDLAPFTQKEAVTRAGKIVKNEPKRQVQGGRRGLSKAKGGAMVGLWGGYGGAIAPHFIRPPLAGAIAPDFVAGAIAPDFVAGAIAPDFVRSPHTSFAPHLVHRTPTSKAHRSSTQTRYIANVQNTLNNTIITITNGSGNTKLWCSSGSIGLKASRRSTNYAAQSVAEAVAKKCSRLGIRRVEVKVQGVGYGKPSALKGLRIGGLKIKRIIDTTPKAHNGCRAPKKRRI